MRPIECYSGGLGEDIRGQSKTGRGGAELDATISLRKMEGGFSLED